MLDEDRAMIERTLAVEQGLPLAYALAILNSDEGDDLRPGALGIAAESDRQGVEKYTGYDRILAFWGVTGWCIPVLRVADQPSDAATYQRASALVSAALWDAFVEDPQRWVLDLLARDLTRRPPTLQVTEDFVAVVVDPDCEWRLRQTLEVVATPERLLAFEREGVLPEWAE